ncbi:unnamed protein product [Arabis nemorensis]|uniref:Uncharacterized protein n=1 Tax=Arabis nemorensis TaxID=586526 RepID=A0A565BK70_9BRAS|nr:unnamed protein product [Arabis nemorensis]
MWDETVAGPKPEHGLGRLRNKITAQPIDIKGAGESSSSKAVLTSPASAGSPRTPTTPGSARKENVWRSVFHPGSNIATRGMGTNLFDKPSHPNSPTVYDWYVLHLRYTATIQGASTVEPRRGSDMHHLDPFTTFCVLDSSISTICVGFNGGHASSCLL